METHAQGMTLENELFDSVQTDINIAIDALKSLTNVKQTLVTYLSCQKALEKEKKSMKQEIGKLRDEKRQLEQDIDKLKMDLQDMILELEMKRNEVLDCKYTDRPPCVPSSSPTTEPNDHEQDSNEDIHSSDNNSLLKVNLPYLRTEGMKRNGDTHTLSEIAEEINKYKPTTTSTEEGTNTVLEFSSKEENRQYACSDEETKSIRPSTPTTMPTITFTEDVTQSNSACELPTCDYPLLNGELTCPKWISFLSQTSAAAATATDEEEDLKEQEKRENFGLIIDTSSVEDNTLKNSDIIITEEEQSFHRKEKEKLKMICVDEHCPEHNVAMPPSRKRHFSNAHYWSPKKWRRMVRTHRLQSIFLENVN